MSEAYWFGGIRFEHVLPPEAEAERIASGHRHLLDALAGEFGLQIARLERVDWFTTRMEGLYSRESILEGFGSSPLTFLWPALPLISHTMLENACAALSQETACLAALVEEGKSMSEAALLGAPAAVGKYNLEPHARLRAHFGAAWVNDALPDCLPRLFSVLDRLEVDPAAIAALAFSGPLSAEELRRPPLWQDVPTNAKPSLHGILPALNWLAETLHASGGNAGLLASFTEDRRAMFTLVEKV
jgi:hypothetical protein